MKSVSIHLTVMRENLNRITKEGVVLSVIKKINKE